MTWLPLILSLLTALIIAELMLWLFRKERRRNLAANDNFEPDVLEAEARDFERASRFTC